MYQQQYEEFERNAASKSREEIDKEKAYNAGAYIGEYLDELGFNVNLE